MNEKIRNIIFDWGGVLVDLDIEGCLSAFEAAGARDIRQYVTGTNELGFFRDYESGVISTPQFRDAIRKYIGQPLEDREIDRIWNSELRTIPEGKLALLERLQQRFRLFLLSNTNELHWESGAATFSFRGKDMRNCFEKLFLSFRMHVVKPEPEIFLRAVREAGLQASETLFIDDSEKNCRAAASVGLQTAHYIPGTDLESLILSLKLQ